jgi:hypothetical protein
VRSVYQTIIRDEARHRRFGSLYFEWAAPALDAEERERLGRVAVHALGNYASLWRGAAQAAETPSALSPEEMHEFGWIEPSRYVPLARRAVTEEILPELAEIGIIVPPKELEALLA